MDDFRDLYEDYGDSSDSSLKKIMYVLIAVVVILLGALIYIWTQKSSAEAENAVLVNEYTIEKQMLTEEMESLKHELDTLYSDYDAINLQLDSSKMEVDILLGKLAQTEATNRSKLRQYEKELGTLRTIMRDYVYQIDSLNNLNKRLTVEAAEARKEATEVRKESEQLSKEVEDLKKRVAAGAVIKAYGIRPVVMSASGKVTDRCKNVDHVVVHFSLGDNELAERGNVDVYLRVKDESGNLLTNSSSHAFTYSGSSMTCSSSRTVDYQGSTVDVAIYLNDIQEYTKGSYTVELYTSYTLLGTSEFMLR